VGEDKGVIPIFHKQLQPIPAKAAKNQI
jgi:hypothetical protein